MNFKQIALSTAVTVGIAVAQSGVAIAGTGSLKGEYAATMAAVKVAHEKAASVGGEWRDTGKFVAQAEAAAEKGEWDKAVKLAKKARFQYERGYAQAVQQKNAGPHF